MRSPNATVEALLQQADTLHHAGKDDSAIEILHSAVREKTPEPSCIFKLAEILIDIDRLEEAAAFLSGMKEPVGARRDELLAACQLGLGNTPAAEVLADRLLTSAEGRARGLVIRGLIARLRKDVEASASYAVSALGEDPGCAAAEDLLGDLAVDGGRPFDALAHYEKSFLLSPCSRSAALKYHGAALKTNAINRAETCLRRACELHPLHRRLRFLKIDLLLRMTEYISAMGEIEFAMAGFGVDEGILAAALSVRAKLGPYSTKRRPSVSLCMIVKDEDEHLARCLHSAKPVVDEIIVVDTGSATAQKESPGPTAPRSSSRRGRTIFRRPGIGPSPRPPVTGFSCWTGTR